MKRVKWLLMPQTGTINYFIPNQNTNPKKFNFQKKLKKTNKKSLKKTVPLPIVDKYRKETS